jgi:hypothetical protein
MADLNALLKSGLISAGAYAKHVGQNLVDTVKYPGQVMQAGAEGRPFDLQGAADWGAGTAIGMAGAGSTLAPKGALGAAGGGKLFIDVPDSKTIINGLEHKHLRELLGYGTNSSVESLRKNALGALEKGLLSERDLRTLYLEGRT